MSDPYKEAPFRIPRDLQRILNKTLTAWTAQNLSTSMYFNGWAVPEEVQPNHFCRLSILLRHGFKSNFSGQISPTSYRWREFEEMDAALKDRVQNRNNLPGVYVPPPAPGPSLQELPRETPSPLEELFREKRDAIFREMVGTPDEYNIWGYRINTKVEVVPAPTLDVEVEMTITGFDWTDTSAVLYTLDTPNANGDVISKDCKITPLHKKGWPSEYSVTLDHVIPGYGDDT